MITHRAQLGIKKNWKSQERHIQWQFSRGFSPTSDLDKSCPNTEDIIPWGHLSPWVGVAVLSDRETDSWPMVSSYIFILG